MRAASITLLARLSTRVHTITTSRILNHRRQQRPRLKICISRCALASTGGDLRWLPAHRGHAGRQQGRAQKVVDASDGFFTEVSGQSVSAESSPTKDQAPANQPSKVIDLFATYRSFSQRVRGRQVRGRAACGDASAEKDGQREAAEDCDQLGVSAGRNGCDGRSSTP